ncbi:MAG: 2-pyrone-4,6-dicarboxylate hydrolase [Alphaproteobacteria bacterium]|nr:2-pyrone-4,6-dicarboxylate hydrolase [Alphaproteobacteria bacterium]
MALRVCYPPDPNPRPPKVKPPPKSCDSHFHVFGPPDVFPYAPQRPYTPPAAPKEHYVTLAAILGLERGVVTTPNAHAPINDSSADLIAFAPDRFRGVARLSGEEPDAELKRLHAAGFRGVRFNLIPESGGRVDLDLYGRIVRRIATMGWSTTIHLRAPMLVEHAAWLESLPSPIVIDHFAYVPFKDGLDQKPFRVLRDLAAKPKFWMKVSCVERITNGLPPWDIAIPFARELIEAAPDRTVWGTDWPHSNRFEPGRTPNSGDLLDLLFEFAPDPKIRQRILVDNPAVLYDFPR